MTMLRHSIHHKNEQQMTYRHDISTRQSREKMRQLSIKQKKEKKKYGAKKLEAKTTHI